MTDTENSKIESAAPKEHLDLRAVREARGLTLKDVFQQTRVSTAHLEAIENEDYRRLPEPIYAKNFIKTYAQALGIDYTAILERYEQRLKSLEAPHEKAADKKPALRSKRPPKYLLTILATVIVIAVIIIIIFLSLQRVKNNPAASSMVAATASKALKADEAARPAAEQSAALKQPASAPMEKKPYKLLIIARDSVWLRVAMDNKPPQELLLRQGDKIEQEAYSSFDLVIGNAGGVDLKFQDRFMGNLGKPGQVVRLKLP